MEPYAWENPCQAATPEFMWRRSSLALLSATEVCMPLCGAGRQTPFLFIGFSIPHGGTRSIRLRDGWPLCYDIMPRQIRKAQQHAVCRDIDRRTKPSQHTFFEDCRVCFSRQHKPHIAWLEAAARPMSQSTVRELSGFHFRRRPPG